MYVESFQDNVTMFASVRNKKKDKKSHWKIVMFLFVHHGRQLVLFCSFLNFINKFTQLSPYQVEPEIA